MRFERSSSHMTPPVREVVGAVYDRAFFLSDGGRVTAEDWPLAGEIAKLPY